MLVFGAYACDGLDDFFSGVFSENKSDNAMVEGALAQLLFVMHLSG